MRKSNIKKICKETDKLCMNPFCTRPNLFLEAHHIIHRSLGGPDILGNLITLCHFCHMKIEDRKIDIWFDIMQYWYGKEKWRWDWALQELKKRPKYDKL